MTAITKPDREIAAVPELIPYRFLCPTCSKVLGEWLSNRPPLVVYVRCIPCHEAEKSARLARRVSREVPCLKCGRMVNAFVDPTDTGVSGCKVCTPTPRRPKERETFCPESRVLQDGKRGAAAAMGKKIRYQQTLDEMNRNAGIRERIYSDTFIETAKLTVEDQAIRTLQKKWGIGCYETTRQGKIGIMRLKPVVEDPPIIEAARKEFKKPRKCPHGVWKTTDDREKSTYCSACHPNTQADVIEWKSEKDDPAILALYLAGCEIKTLAKRFHTSKKKIVRSLQRSRMDAPEPEAKELVELEEAEFVQKLAIMNNPEEFGFLPVDPQSVVSQDVA
jgi:hypothetical protein